MSIRNSTFLIHNYSFAVDVPQTWADVTKANKLFGYKPSISFKDGVTEFYKWQKAKQTF